jgi:hypothetical protein
MKYAYYFEKRLFFRRARGLKRGLITLNQLFLRQEKASWFAKTA